MQGSINYNPQIEDTIIGTLLLEPSQLEVILEEGIRDSHFFDVINQKIFEVTLKAWNEKGNKLTFDLILEELKKYRVVPDYIEEGKLFERYA
ncbi:MAG TPA: hypothetical protein EYH48_05230, partial [Aquifex aeolicus]|nr:hypothetical protein [Aquifex aeolicus]